MFKGENTTVTNQYYNQYVKQVTPTFSTVKNCVMAYIIGGAICVIGQGLTSFFL